MASIKEFQTFVAIVQEKSFTKAAEKTYMSQSAVSKQLKKLEAEIGVQLVERYDREVMLTEYGDVFYQHVVTILENYYRLQETVQELQQLQAGYLDVGASTLPGEYILPSILGEFKTLFPNINVRMKIAKTNEIISMLKNRVVKVAFIGADIDDEELDLQSFIEDELVLVGAVQPKIKLKPSLHQWTESLITRESGSGTRTVVEKFLREKNITLPGSTMELGSNRAILSAVISGMGCSFLSKWVTQDAIKLGKIQQIPIVEGSIKRQIYVAVLKDRYLNPVTKEFIHFIHRIPNTQHNQDIRDKIET
ncbi:LysR family transcriptional regulator [Desulfuribacillus alkaliarsenatis]|uniref:HTH lysR-type domain-containing protein n=1 Tax=Desulfuribacillus alkaliarsenatis TaxID=766136 RepID=A0A1E5FZE6_9FIRM|nr:LysR family transcriptional regulator [Desulfuribacillus alkaliarsenatis]OEF95933.1 hypothetical protein BHF68_11120 [Desulfuribacillus alkaliarsenatis]